MARIEKDAEDMRHHGAILERIRKGFRELLWSNRLGVAGRCREQGEDGRLMENPWSYSVFMPIDMDLTDPVEAAQALCYSKWAYECERTQNGRVMSHSGDWITIDRGWLNVASTCRMTYNNLWITCLYETQTEGGNTILLGYDDIASIDYFGTS